MMKTKELIFAAVAMFYCIVAHGETLNFQCMRSFNVKDATIDLDNQTLSCRLVEESRERAFALVSEIIASNDYQVASIVADLESTRQQFLDAASTSDFSVVSSIVVGNAIGSMGLAGCVQTAGFGCAIGAAGFVWAKYETIRYAVSTGEKTRAAQAIATKIAELEKIAGEAEDLVAAKNRLVADFNYMCALVQEHCLD